MNWVPNAAIHEVPDDPEAMFEYAIARGWSDGLPVLPPTPERVSRMMAATVRPPEEVVARLNPRQGDATVERVAINAVMAGCAPEHFTIVLAAVEAVAERAFNLHGIQATTNPVGPLVIVNGPARLTAGMNCGRNALGPGCRANATIGRALRLCMINIGGGIPGETDKAILGMPGKYTFCLGENEEESPWEPLHATRGFSAADSAVTVVGAQGTNNVVILSGIAEDALYLVADAMMTMGNNNVVSGNGNPVVFISPGNARLMVEQGFKTRRSVQEYLFEHARIPVERFPAREILPSKPMSIRTIIDGKVCALHRPEDLLVVVAGGPEPYHLTYCASIGNSIAATRKVGA
ncbi:MAG: hypothetical protein EXR31_08950 [Betaproteobacteria bacterium]|nr:hypothetical protein [Betaproteobacteria bacterium]